MVQFVSHVLPASDELACSQRADVGVMCDQMNRTSIGLPLSVMSPKKVPTPFSNRPLTGGSISPKGPRPSSHQIDHCSVFGSYARSPTARYAPPGAFIKCSSTLAQPSMSGRLSQVPSMSAHSLVAARI